MARNTRQLVIAGLTALLGTSAAAADLDEVIAVATGGRLEIELDGGSVDIESHDANEVRIDAHGRNMEFDLSHDGDEVQLMGSSSSWWRRGKVLVRARVPRRFSVEVTTRGGRIDVEEIEGDVELETSGGPIDIDRVHGDVEAKTSGGRIDATEIDGDLELETSGGTIRISEARGEIEAETSGGNIRVSEVDGHVEAETSGGGIEVRWRSSPGGQLRTSGGSIDVAIPAGSGLDLEAHTSGGRISIDGAFELEGDVSPSEVDARLGGGGESLELRTSGGGIRVRKR